MTQKGKIQVPPGFEEIIGGITVKPQNLSESLIESFIFPSLTKNEEISVIGNKLDLRGRDDALIVLAGFRRLSELEEIDLSECGLEQIPINLLSSAANLRVLHLNHNKITKIPPNFSSNFNLLEHLDLSHNQLTDISTLASLNTLDTLILDSNKIKSLSPFVNCASLRILSVNDNNITSIPIGLRVPILSKEGNVSLEKSSFPIPRRF